MHLIRPLIAFAAAGLAVAAPAQPAAPFVTVSPPGADGPTMAWWVRDMTSAPTGTHIATLPLARINATLDETETPWCAANVLTPDAFASPDPTLAAEIRAYLAEVPDAFRATTNMTGRRLTALVGNFRSCAGEVAPFVMLIDERSRMLSVAFVRMFTDWTPFITVRRYGEDLIFSSCFECGHAEILSYDRRARRFYWRSDGL